MKRFFVAVFAAFMALGVSVPEAEAKRFGGGKSSGFQRDNSTLKRDAAPAAPAGQQAAPARPASQPGGASRWLGPLAGLAAGIGLAALLSHLGLGEGFASILMLVLLAAAAFFLFRMFFRRKSAAAAAGPLRYAAATPGGSIPAAGPAALGPIGGGTAPPAAGRIPAGFDAATFLRQAKLNFVRMQAAHDSGNVEDIREFTTPEMFAEVRLQMQESGAETQHTDVVSLDAEVLDVAEEAGRYVVSTRFSGTIRETREGAAEPFDEVWHLVKPVAGGSGWVVAGIQQMQ